MLTPTRREIAETEARKMPRGAQLWGGRYDGATAATVKNLPAYAIPDGRPTRLVVVMLDDGTELGFAPSSVVRWLHPAGRQVTA